MNARKTRTTATKMPNAPTSPVVLSVLATMIILVTESTAKLATVQKRSSHSTWPLCFNLKSIQKQTSHCWFLSSIRMVRSWQRVWIQAHQEGAELGRKSDCLSTDGRRPRHQRFRDIEWERVRVKFIKSWERHRAIKAKFCSKNVQTM